MLLTFAAPAMAQDIINITDYNEGGDNATAPYAPPLDYEDELSDGQESASDEQHSNVLDAFFVELERFMSKIDLLETAPAAFGLMDISPANSSVGSSIQVSFTNQMGNWNYGGYYGDRWPMITAAGAVVAACAVLDGNDPINGTLMIKIAMSSYAEIDGQEALEENERLKESPLFKPVPESEKNIRRTVQREMLRNTVYHFGKGFYSVANKAAMLFLVVTILFSTTMLASANFRSAVYKLVPR